MQINFSNFFKNGFHFLVLTVLMLGFAIFVNYRIYTQENLKAEQIASLQSFMQANPLVIQKSNLEHQLISDLQPKQILISIEKFFQDFEDIQIKSLSLNKKQDREFVVNLSLHTTYAQYIRLIDLLTFKSPLSQDFPYLVEINQFSLNLASFESAETQDFTFSFIIYTL